MPKHSLPSLRRGSPLWIAPARHHTYHEIARNRPDIVILCNDHVILAIEVKNWATAGRISAYNVFAGMAKRFLSVPSGAIQILLSTSDNFIQRERCLKLLEAGDIKLRLIQHRPLPHRNLAPTIDEMTHVLEEFVTLDLLKNKAYG